MQPQQPQYPASNGQHAHAPPPYPQAGQQQAHYRQQQPHPQHQYAPQQTQAVAISPKQQKFLADIDLLPGEQMTYLLEGDGFFVGSNPIAKAVAAFQASMLKLTGGHSKVFIVLTNKRVMMIHSVAMWCGFMRSKTISAIALGSVAEAGWAKDTQWCCIHSRAVHMESKTQKYTVVVKKLSDHGLREFMANLSHVLVGNVQSGLVT